MVFLYDVISSKFVCEKKVVKVGFALCGENDPYFDGLR